MIEQANNEVAGPHPPAPVWQHHTHTQGRMPLNHHSGPQSIPGQVRNQRVRSAHVRVKEEMRGGCGGGRV